MIAILPSAGYATRMYPLTENFPKPLLPIQDKPIIEYTLSKLIKIGVKKVIIVTNNKYYLLFVKWKDELQSPLKIVVLNNGSTCNENRLGAIKDIAFALKEGEVGGDFIVINPDNFYTFNLNEMKTDFHKRQTIVIALYDVKTLEQARKMGNPKLNGIGRVVDFKEKDHNITSTICSIGIYFFPKNVKDLLFKYLEEGNPPDYSGNFLSWLHKNTEVYGFLFDSKEQWFDIGSIESYEQAKQVKDLEKFL